MPGIIKIIFAKRNADSFFSCNNPSSATGISVTSISIDIDNSNIISFSCLMQLKIVEKTDQ
jgi:hypothetical protein